mmetsp:Transcript_48734/g.137095  ORF Transcript_48734/g.137095 Transcript_48734/m.137095 type:complete len:247 (-) Transcript_48734:835-1575(-)
MSEPPAASWLKSSSASKVSSSFLAARRSASRAMCSASEATLSKRAARRSAQARPFRSRALQRSCSRANSTLASRASWPAWPLESSRCAAAARDKASLAWPLSSSSFSPEASCAAAADEAAAVTAASARFTAALAAWRICDDAARERCLAASLTPSSLPCAFCSLAKMPRNSFSSRPWAVCSFTSTCAVALPSFDCTAAMLFSASAGGRSSLGHSAATSTRWSTSDSASCNRLEVSVRDLPTLIRSS